MELKRLDPDDPRPEFCCGDGDIDEYFAVDSIGGGKELISVTYAYLSDVGRVRGFFSVSNDAIKKEDVPKARYKRLVKALRREKRYSSMPATKIGRLGVCQTEQRNGVGTEILDYLKVWFTNQNKTGCRFLVVDAYNQPNILDFYRKNGFEFLKETEDDKKEKNRIMYFDLKTFRP